MARVALILNSPTLKVAATEAELATAGMAIECQVTSALVNSSPVYATIPSTGCAGATQSPGLTGFALELAWLQDWGEDGLSFYAFDHDGESAFVEFTPDSTKPTQKLTGSVYVAAGQFGGTFGDGSAATATATWPFQAKPTIPAPALAAA